MDPNDLERATRAGVERILSWFDEHVRQHGKPPEVSLSIQDEAARQALPALEKALEERGIRLKIVHLSSAFAGADPRVCALAGVVASAAMPGEWLGTIGLHLNGGDTQGWVQDLLRRLALRGVWGPTALDVTAWVAGKAPVPPAVAEAVLLDLAEDPDAFPFRVLTGMEGLDGGMAFEPEQDPPAEEPTRPSATLVELKRR